MLAAMRRASSRVNSLTDARFRRLSASRFNSDAAPVASSIALRIPSRRIRCAAR